LRTTSTMAATMDTMATMGSSMEHATMSLPYLQLEPV
jgi:hypothetical protein